MLNQTVGTSNTLAWLKERKEQFLLIQSEHQVESDEKLVHLNGRAYCINCGANHTHQQTTPHFQATSMPYKLKHYLTVLYGKDKMYTCSECGQTGVVTQQRSIWVHSDSIKSLSCKSNIKEVLIGAYSVLEDLNQEGFENLVKLTAYFPKTFKMKNSAFSDDMRGYQLLRYPIQLKIDTQSLKIIPYQQPWEVAYFCLGENQEIAFQQKEGQIEKMAKNKAFLDYFNTVEKTSENLQEKIQVNMKEGNNWFNRTGLRHHIEFLQSRREDQGLEVEDLNSIYKYEQFRQAYPCIEQLVKSGYASIVQIIVNEASEIASYSSFLAYALLQPKATTPTQALGYPKAILKELKAKQVFESLYTAHTMKYLQKAGVLDLAFLKEYNQTIYENVLRHHSQRLIQLHELGYPGAGVLRYLKKVWETQALPMNDAIILLSDYAQMVDDMDVMQDRFPKYLKIAHDLMVRRYEYQKDEILNNKFAKNVEAYQHLGYQPEGANFFIALPETPDDLVHEGQKLSHCVASYVKQMANGKSIILFLRQTSEPETPYITIEWADGQIVQARGFANAPITNYPEAYQFFNQWKEQLNLQTDEVGA